MFTSMTEFEQAATTGSRHVDWDGLAVDGSDPGSTVIETNHVAAVARDRLEPWGIELGSDVAVANDGFHSVNGSVAFTPFSPPNVWAPFNSNSAELRVVIPAGQGTTPVPAETRGLGIAFLNVTASGTSIQYFNGDIPLWTQPVPNGATFVGVLFPDAVVTRAVVTLGTAQIFAFDGSHVTPTPSAIDFVAGDDMVLAEPTPARSAMAATAGVPATGVLDTFTESNPNATPKAVIDWGDGTTSPGTVTAGSGGTFLVIGGHAYAHAGGYIAEVTVNDSSGPEQIKQVDIAVAPRATLTSVVCSPSSVAVTATATCVATVSDVDAGNPSAPTGLVTFATPTAGAVFPGSGSCLLGPATTRGSSLCVVQFEPGQLPPAQARATAVYAGDAAHAGSTAVGSVAVRPQRCTLRALSRRLRPGGLGVLVTCDARSGVQIAVQARVARKGRLGAFHLQFGLLRTSVTAGRPTVLVVKPSPGVLPALRAALHRHQRISLKLTLTASSRPTTRTTTTRASALRLSLR
jgi:hypothetical protein